MSDNAQKFISIYDSYLNENETGSLHFSDILKNSGCADILDKLQLDELFELSSYYFLRNKTIHKIITGKINNMVSQVSKDYIPLSIPADGYMYIINKKDGD